MTLASTLSTLEATLDAARDGDLVQERLGRARDYDDELRSACERLATSVVAVEELSKAGRRPPAEAAVSAVKLEKAIARFKAKAENKLLSIVDKEMRDLAKEATNFAAQVAGWTAATWSREVAAAKAFPNDEEFISQLDRAGLPVGDVRALIESAEREVIVVTGRGQPTSGDVDRLSSALAQRQRATELLQELLPAEVAPFIGAVSQTGGAPLDLLTPEVLEFLERTDSAGRYRIKVV